MIMLREDILNETKELLQKNGASSLSKSRQLIKVLELVTEAMPQFVFRLKVFNQISSLNGFCILFSSSKSINIIIKSQLISIATYSLSIVFGLKIYFCFEAFQYLEPRVVKA